MILLYYGKEMKHHLKQQVRYCDLVWGLGRSVDMNDRKRETKREERYSREKDLTVLTVLATMYCFLKARH